MTLKEWKANLRPGMTLICTYRWYWGSNGKPAPPDMRELCKIVEVKATQMIYHSSSQTEKPDTRCYMYFPKAGDLKADENGFELYMPADKFKERAGELMSRYEYSKSEAA